MCPARGCVLAVLKLANTVSVDPVPSVVAGQCFSGRGLDAARQTLVRLGMPKGEGFGRVDSARMVGPLETTSSKGTRDSTEEREETVTAVVSPTGSAGTLRDTSPGESTAFGRSRPEHCPSQGLGMYARHASARWQVEGAPSHVFS